MRANLYYMDVKKIKKMKNKVDVLLGLQWGDEGKGKIVDYLSPNYDMIARYQGGANAGHTLKIDGKTHVLHIIPSGIFHKNKLNLIGNGVVVDPVIFKEECEQLVKLGVDVHSRLLIAKKAHLILPSHRLLDAVYEKSKGNLKIGSTLKGIGPTYTDKTARLGLRIGNSLAADFVEKYNILKNSHLKIVAMYGDSIADFKIDNKPFDVYEKEWFAAIEYLKSFQLVECENVVNNMLKNGKTILAEGAQGTMLDVDYGTYPFVTSSNTVSAGVCTGLGISPHDVGKVFGITKAYCTRVGAGPFPTELFDKVGELLREKGREFGATTGRPRRCGWIDLVQLKYSVMINGVTDLIITKPDVLNNLDVIKLCTAYNIDGKHVDEFPFCVDEGSMSPVYTELPGWCSDLSYAAGIAGLPPKFVSYLDFLNQQFDTKITVISTGPGREETIKC